MYARFLSIQKVVKNIIRPNQPPLLGRWRLNYSEEELGKTIDRANEDHCGTCVNPPKEPKLNLKKRS
jgi:hypothetical protein